MSIQHIIERVEKNDKSLMQIILNATDKVEEGELSKLVEALKKNTYVQVIDFSKRTILDKTIIWIVELLSANKNIKEVSLKASVDPMVLKSLHEGDIWSRLHLRFCNEHSTRPANYSKPHSIGVYEFQDREKLLEELNKLVDFTFKLSIASINVNIQKIVDRNKELEKLRNNNLLNVNLEGTNITQGVIEIIIKNIGKIKVLNLSNCVFQQDIMPRNFDAALVGSQVIEEINFSGIKGINISQWVEAVAKAPSLKKVTFDRAGVTEEQLNKLESLLLPTFKIDLVPRSNSATEKRVDAISVRNKCLKALKSTEDKVVALDLSESTITFGVLDDIVQNAVRIKSIDLCGCAFQKGVLEKLKRELSLCFETKNSDGVHSIFRRNKMLAELKSYTGTEKILSFEGVLLTKDALNIIIANLSKVKTIKLDGCEFEEKLLKELFEKLVELQSYKGTEKILSFENTLITKDVLNIVIANLAKVKTLKFARCEFENGVLKELAQGLGDNKNIQEVSITQTKIPTDVVGDLLALPCKLVFTKDCFDEEAKKAVANFLQRQTDLSRFDFGISEVDIFLNKKESDRKEISFNNRTIDEIDVAFLCKMGFEKQLKIETLRFVRCVFKNGLLKELAQGLRDNKNIQEVSITQTKISADVVGDLLILPYKFTFTKDCFDEEAKKAAANFLKRQTDVARFDFGINEINIFLNQKENDRREISFNNRTIDEIDVLLLSKMIFEKSLKIEMLRFVGCVFKNGLLKELVQRLRDNKNIQEVSITQTKIPTDVVDDLLALPCKLTFTKGCFDGEAKKAVANFLKQQTGVARFDFGINEIKGFLNKRENERREISFNNRIIDEIDVAFLHEISFEKQLKIEMLRFVGCEFKNGLLKELAQGFGDNRNIQEIAMSQTEIPADVVGDLLALPCKLTFTKDCFDGEAKRKIFDFANQQVNISRFNFGYIETKNGQSCGSANDTIEILILLKLVRGGFRFESLDISSKSLIKEIVPILVEILNTNALVSLSIIDREMSFSSLAVLADVLEKNKTLANIRLGHPILSANPSSQEKDELSNVLIKIILRKETSKVSFDKGDTVFFNQLLNVFIEFNKKNQSKEIEFIESSKFNPSSPHPFFDLTKETNVSENDKYCVKLSGLSLSVAHIKVIIACLENNPRINDVDLSNNDLGDEGIRILFEAIKNKNLNISRLNLSKNKIKDAGMAEIVNSLKINNTLIHLNLGSNLFSSNALLDLANLREENKTLIELYLENSNFSDVSIVEFLKRFYGKTYPEQRRRNKSILRLSFGSAIKPATQREIDAALADNIAAASKLYGALLSNDFQKFKEGYKTTSPYYSKDEKGNTLLHVAVERGFKEIVEFLWSEGVRDIPNKEGETALDLAREKNDRELVNILSQSRQQSSVSSSVPVTLVSRDTLKRREPPAAAKAPPPKKTKPNENNGVENAPQAVAQNETQDLTFSANPFGLHEAVTCGDYKKVKLLLSSDKGNINARNIAGWTALRIALFKRNIDMVHRLLAEPALAENVLRDARDFFKEERKTDNYLNELLLSVEQRISNEQPTEVGLQWVKSLNVVYGGRGKKSIVIDGDKQLALLILQNKFTQQRLAQPLKNQSDEIAKDVDGNPVSASLTFVVSKGRHYQNQHNERTTITISLEFTTEFHITHGDEDYTDRLRKRMRLDDDNQMNIDSQDPLFANKYHHGEQALLEYLEQKETINKIVAQLLNSPNMHGAKIYGVVLDIATPRYPCSNCQIAISGEQRSDSEFLKELKLRLQSVGMQVPKFSDLRMITRVGSYQAFGIGAITAEEHHKMVVDMRTCKNSFILAKDLAAVGLDHTQFISRAK